MATPFPFGSGNVLTAAQLNAITTLPVSTKTTSYTLTVADVGYRIVMNSASATTITVNTSIFGASDKVEILNIGAGVCTVTAGTCTVGTTGTLALAQNAGGTLTFISASASIFTSGDVTATAGGLVPITQVSNTFSGASAITFDTNTFTSTYKNYRAIITIRAATLDTTLTGRFRTSGTNNTSAIYSQYSPGNPTAIGVANATSFDMGSMDTTVYLYCLTLDFIDPQVAGPCAAMGNLLYLDSATAYQGRAINLGVYNTAQFDSFTIISSAGTLTGTYRVYAYSE